MNCDPYKVVKDFEKALCEYTGAKYAVTVTSCTAALMLAVAWHLQYPGGRIRKAHEGDYRNPYAKWFDQTHVVDRNPPLVIEIPKRTYISVPMSIIHAGGRPAFRDENWTGEYQLKPLPVWDCARWFRRDMYRPGQMMCLSFHWTKQLSIGQGGCLLHDNDEADEWLRRMRFDGRREGVAPKDDTFTMIGSHCYMSPRDAAEGLSRLAVFKDSGPLPNDPYPDLSLCDIFK